MPAQQSTDRCIISHLSDIVQCTCRAESPVC